MNEETKKEVWLKAYLAAAAGCYASSKEATVDCVASEAAGFAERAVRDYANYIESFTQENLQIRY
jgi:hypothetical protein